MDLLRFTHTICSALQQVDCLPCASFKQLSVLPRQGDSGAPLPFRSEGQISTNFVGGVVVVDAAVESKWRCLISAAAAAAAAGSAMSSNDAAADEVLTLAIALVVVVLLVVVFLVVVAVVALAVVVVVEVMVVVVAVEVVVLLVDGRLLEELARRESEQV